jgi:hypothetical protein
MLQLYPDERQKKVTLALVGNVEVYIIVKKTPTVGGLSHTHQPSPIFLIGFKNVASTCLDVTLHPIQKLLI